MRKTDTKKMNKVKYACSQIEKKSKEGKDYQKEERALADHTESIEFIELLTTRHRNQKHKRAKKHDTPKREAIKAQNEIAKHDFCPF